MTPPPMAVRTVDREPSAWNARVAGVLVGRGDPVELRRACLQLAAREVPRAREPRVAQGEEVLEESCQTFSATIHPPYSSTKG